MENTYIRIQGKVSDEVLLQEIEGEAVLLSLSSEKYFGLNRVGMRIWDLLSVHGDSDRVLEVLCNEFDTDEKILAYDLSALISSLVEHGLFLVED